MKKKVSYRLAIVIYSNWLFDWYGLLSEIFLSFYKLHQLTKFAYIIVLLSRFIIAWVSFTVTDNITRIYTTGRNILGFKYFFASLGNQRKLSQE